MQMVCEPPRKQPRLGLALGGGGARGLAHIHVLAAFDDLELKPEIIAGTSIGALMGCAYASGMTANDIREHCLNVLSDYTTIFKHIWGTRPTNWQDWRERGLRMSQFDLPILLERFLPASMKQDLSQLHIPTKVIAADIYSGREVVLERGNIKMALAASASIPGIFAPVSIDDHLLIDGGLCNPIPFDHILDHCDISIAVNILWDDKQVIGNKPGLIALLMAANAVSQKALVTARLKYCRPHLMLRPPVGDIFILDFHKIKTILANTDCFRDQAKYAIEQQMKLFDRDHGNI